MYASLMWQDDINKNGNITGKGANTKSKPDDEGNIAGGQKNSMEQLENVRSEKEQIEPVSVSTKSSVYSTIIGNALLLHLFRINTKVILMF